MATEQSLVVDWRLNQNKVSK